MLFGAGMAVRYVLGARAGRPAYDRIVARYRDTLSATGLDSATDTVRSAGSDLRDAVADRTTDIVQDATENASAKLGDAADAVRGSSGSSSGGS